MSADSSGGVRSSVSFTASTIWETGSLRASRISTELASVVFGIPLTRSRPLTLMVISSFSGIAEPTSHLIASPVRSPIRMLWFFLKNWMMALFISSPATRIDSSFTMPESAMTAISVVPPPMSTIMLPTGASTSRPTPIAAAMGSAMRCTSLAPACSAESRTARFSTSVTPLGTHTTMRRLGSQLAWIFLMNSLSIPSAISKSAMTPSFIGRIVLMSRCVLPSISWASRPMATIFLVFRSNATMEGSLRTIPLPFM
ncbi:MAG: hypothetical protein H6Q28_345 [Bacteroidetes bacterium]|nr:hypothetical protein [Bacteroidota bacterium]